MNWEEHYREECERLGCVKMYDKILAKEKCNPSFAAMLAQKNPPALDTDTSWLAAHPRSSDNMEGMTARSAKQVLRRAKKAGISTAGMVHISGLGPPSDPCSWVEGKSDMIRKAKIKNAELVSSGKVINAIVEMEPKEKKPKLSKDITQALSRKHKAENLDCKLEGQELKEMIIDKHAYKG
jgi:hypothetical protein